MKNKSGKKVTFKALLTGLICIGIAFTIIPRAKIIWELSERKQGLEQVKTELTEENTQLRAELKKANSAENIERIAREQLGMVKEGEKVLVPVIEDQPDL